MDSVGLGAEPTSRAAAMLSPSAAPSSPTRACLSMRQSMRTCGLWRVCRVIHACELPPTASCGAPRCAQDRFRAPVSGPRAAPAPTQLLFSPHSQAHHISSTAASSALERHVSSTFHPRAGGVGVEKYDRRAPRSLRRGGPVLRAGSRWRKGWGVCREAYAARWMLKGAARSEAAEASTGCVGVAAHGRHERVRRCVSGRRAGCGTRLRCDRAFGVGSSAMPAGLRFVVVEAAESAERRLEVGA